MRLKSCCCSSTSSKLIIHSLIVMWLRASRLLRVAHARTCISTQHGSDATMTLSHGCARRLVQYVARSYTSNKPNAAPCNCWQCGVQRAIPDAAHAPFCGACGAIQPVTTTDYFAVLGMCVFLCSHEHCTTVLLAAPPPLTWTWRHWSARTRTASGVCIQTSFQPQDTKNVPILSTRLPWSMRPTAPSADH